MAEVIEGTIKVTTTGDELDTAVIEQADGTMAHREAVHLADPKNPLARAGVVEVPPIVCARTDVCRLLSRSGRF